MKKKKIFQILIIIPNDYKNTMNLGGIVYIGTNYNN